jgi:hypothetical protein
MAQLVQGVLHLGVLQTHLWAETTIQSSGIQVSGNKNAAAVEAAFLGIAQVGASPHPTLALQNS